MISLRISDREYEAMRALFPTYGARNVSDFARLAMQRIISNSFAPEAASQGMLALKVNQLDQRLTFLESRMSALTGGKVLD